MVLNIRVENASRIAIEVVFIVNLHRLLVLLAPVPVHHRIMRNAQHPGNELSARTVLAFVKFGDDFNERFLEQILRHTPVVYNEQDIRKQPRLVAFKQQVESFVVPIDVRHGQFLVGHIANLNHFLMVLIWSTVLSIGSTF